MPSRRDVQSWIIVYVAEFAGIDPEAVKPETPFSRFGLDSSDAVIMGGVLEEAFDVEVDATLILRNETVEGLMDELEASGVVTP